MKKNEKSNPAIQLNSTFMRLSTGEATISKVIAKREAIRAAAKAKDGSAVIRRREGVDPFGPNFCR
jgi:hypothetical protein